MREEAEWFARLEAAAAAVPAAGWPAGDDDGAVVGESLEEPAAAAGDPLDDEDEDGVGEMEPGRFGVFTNRVIPDGAVTEGVGTGGMGTDGAVTDGVLTVGAGPTGVVTWGVVTDGTVTDGTVTCGVVTAGRLAAGVLTVGSPTLGSVAAVPASGWVMSRAKPAATPANEQILRMPLERPLVMKLAHSGTNCRRIET